MRGRGRWEGEGVRQGLGSCGSKFTKRRQRAMDDDWQIVRREVRVK